MIYRLPKRLNVKDSSALMALTCIQNAYIHKVMTQIKCNFSNT